MATRLLKDILQEILISDHANELVKQHSYQGLNQTQKTDLEAKDIQLYEGKVRQCLFHNRQEQKEAEMEIVHTDLLSAFDRKIGYVPYKGVMLATISDFWFKTINKTHPSHYIRQTQARVLKTKKLQPIKAEVIVRGYLAGSMMRAYAKGEREFCGETLPEDLKAYGKLKEAIITPTSKAEAFEHDENRTPAQLIDEGICTEQEWKDISKMALEIFAIGQKIYLKKGWILVDTKYEFGKDENGKIYIIDEVHTPDSSRLWVEANYLSKISENKAPDMLDKEIVRRELLEKDFSGEGEVPAISAKSIVELAQVYLNVAETLTGQKLQIEEVAAPVDISGFTAQ